MRPRRPDHRPDDRDRVRPLQHRGDHRRGDDRADQVLVEELALVHFVVLLGHRALDFQKPERRDAQPPPFEAREKLAGDRALHGIGLEDDERSLGGQDAIPIRRSSPAGASSAASEARGPIAAT